MTSKSTVLVATLGLALAFTYGCDAAKEEDGLTDSRDGKKYKTVKIGEQTWMAENLNYAAEGSVCYGNSESNCQKFGRLYTWEYGAKVCPSGWHIPALAEWDALTAAVGDESNERRHLKAASGWDYDGNGLDTYGFAALPGGAACSTLMYPNGEISYQGLGGFGYWWLANGSDCYQAYAQYWDYEENMGGGLGCHEGTYLCGIRCIKDN